MDGGIGGAIPGCEIFSLLDEKTKSSPSAPCTKGILERGRANGFKFVSDCPTLYNIIIMVSSIFNKHNFNLNFFLTIGFDQGKVEIKARFRARFGNSQLKLELAFMETLRFVLRSFSSNTQKIQCPRNRQVLNSLSKWKVIMLRVRFQRGNGTQQRRIHDE